MFKKIFLSVMLAIGILFVSQIEDIQKAYAVYYDVSDYYAYTDNSGTAYYIYYVSYNSLGVEVKLKGVKNGKAAEEIRYNFNSEGTTYSVFSGFRFSVRTDAGSTSSNANAQKVWNIVSSKEFQSKSAKETQDNFALINEQQCYYKAEEYFKNKDYKNAIQWYQRLTSNLYMTSNYVFEGYYGLGNCYGELENFDQAISNYKKSLEIKPQASDAHFALSVIYFAKKMNLNQAMSYINNAITYNPQKAIYYNVRGMIYELQGNKNEAKNNYKQALRLSPNYKEAQQNFARVSS